MIERQSTHISLEDNRNTFLFLGQQGVYVSTFEQRAQKMLDFSIIFRDNKGILYPNQCWGYKSGTGSVCFWASRIRILPISHKFVERTEIMLAK